MGSGGGSAAGSVGGSATGDASHAVAFALDSEIPAAADADNGRGIAAAWLVAASSAVPKRSEPAGLSPPHASHADVDCDRLAAWHVAAASLCCNPGGVATEAASHAVADCTPGGVASEAAAAWLSPRHGSRRSPHSRTSSTSAAWLVAAAEILLLATSSSAITHVPKPMGPSGPSGHFS